MVREVAVKKTQRKAKPRTVYYIGWVGSDISIRPVLATSPAEAKEIYAAWDGVVNPRAAIGWAKQTRSPPEFAIRLPPING